jgi:hypothetical protein
MQKLQRKAGQLLKRTADDAEVALLMKEFDEGDNMLKIVRPLPFDFFRAAFVEVFVLIDALLRSDNRSHQAISRLLDGTSSNRLGHGNRFR